MEKTLYQAKFNKCCYGLVCGLVFCCSCRSIHVTNQLPADIYRISTEQYQQLDPAVLVSNKPKSLKAEVGQSDSMLIINPVQEQLQPLSIRLDDVKQLKLYRYTFDIDVLTVPFKVRPAASGFPEQFNANFDAALYFGRRRDSYIIDKTKKGRSEKTRITGVGYGYGGFVGAGSVTMNPFVTNQLIDYEYDGFVLNGGFAGIYDAKKFNLGIAIGADFLVDKNSSKWIYQGKPWFGVLFGINLN